MQPRLRAVLGILPSNPPAPQPTRTAVVVAPGWGLMTEAKVLEKALLDDVASIHSLNV